MPTGITGLERVTAVQLSTVPKVSGSDSPRIVPDHESEDTKII
jgi:hypothetical protein